MAVGMLKDAGRFSAFKERKQVERISDLLADHGTGEMKSWEQFKKEAMPLAVQHNKVWLQPEYDQALSNAEMGKKWNGFKENEGRYPNLQYRAVMDARTRDEHAKLNGTILPLSDPFWSKFYPPNGWGCRCSVVQTDKPVNRPELLNTVNPEQGFGFNPGTDKKIFADDSGYYQGWGKKEGEAISNQASRLLRPFFEKEAKAVLKGKSLTAESLPIRFNPKSVEKTYNMNSSAPEPALAAIQNTAHIEDMMREANYHPEEFIKSDEKAMKANKGVLKFHVWDGSGYKIVARETTSGIFFYYLKLL